ncbi:hypothetical protein V5O48_011880 [Marasmius crinis-equi]|uniref:F-box domain-containing protein n=1 Tax=Marasmius crinis-equi TaxID=585013 RepID=A0ABR3F4D3_9AGAR
MSPARVSTDLVDSGDSSACTTGTIFRLPTQMSRESNLARQSAEILKFFRSTTSNKATVSQFLHNAELEMQEYQTEINKLKTAIYALENKRNRLKRTAEMYKSLLAPIHIVPSEILTMIFQFFCEKNVLSRRSTFPRAILLSMVCGRWKELVYSTPSLWSGIEIDLTSWTGEFHALNEMTERFLGQSGTSPLRLSLGLPADNFTVGHSQCEGARPALCSLVATSQRWESVSLQVAPPYFPSSVFEPIRGRLPILTSLGLKGPANASQFEGWGQPFDFFSISPALRSVRIEVGSFKFGARETSLPFAQLTSLQMSASFNVWAFPIVALCPAVEHLEVTQIGGLESNSLRDYSGHITSSKVKTLAITSAIAQVDVDGVLRHTTLGGLSSLRIHGYSHAHRNLEDWPNWDETHLRNFLQRSACSITSLSLSYLPITDEQTISLLRMIPTIKSLCIKEFRNEFENRIVTKTFLDGLAVNTSLGSPFSTPLVPRLTHLRLVVHAKDIQPDPLLGALSSRWLPDPTDAAKMGVDCLRSVAIVVMLDGDHDDEQEEMELAQGDCLNGLFCFKDAGMELSITYGTLSELYPK